MGQKINNARKRFEKIQHLYDNGGSIEEARIYLSNISVPNSTHNEHMHTFSIYQDARKLIEKWENERNNDEN